MRVLFFFKNAEWLGIEYLSAVLKQHGHQTDLFFNPGAGDVEYKIKLFDTKKLLHKRIERKIDSFKPDLICLSILTNLFPWAKEIISFIREQHPEIPIIAGGLHPTMFPELVLSHPAIDFVCVGEGEEAIVELVQQLQRNKLEYNIKNIFFKKDGKIISNPLRPLLSDLDSLPFPDKDMFYKYGCFRNRIYVMTGRGCPYDCGYCFNKSYKEQYKDLGKYVRRQSVSRTIDELKYFQSKFKFKEIFFYDDTFTLQEQWVVEFCERYKKEINKPFACNIRANTINMNILNALKKAGCYYVVMGVESGVERVRNEVMRRHLSDQTMTSAANMVHSAGIKLCTLNVIGLPTETGEEIWKTVEFNWRLKPNGGSMASTFYPFPKTDLYFLSIEKGYLSGKNLEDAQNGIGGYRGESLLDHPYKKTIKKVMIFESIMVRLPKFTHKLIKKLPPWNIFRIFSIPFYSPLNHLTYRIKEFVLMQYYYYFKNN